MSVIIPTFNRAALVEKAVRSCLAQTYPVHEILVCDDGSTDDTEQRIKAITDPRVQWLSGEHAGRPAVPRNRGLKKASGDWFAFLDSDDTWEHNKLEIQFQRIALNGMTASCTNAWVVRPGEETYLRYFNDGDRRISFDDVLTVNPVICSSALIHRDAATQAGYFPEAEEYKALEDYAYWLRVAVFTDFDRTEIPLVSYTDDAKSSVRADAVPVQLHRELILKDLQDWADRNPAQVSRGQLSAISNQLSILRRPAETSFWERLFRRSR